MTINDIKALANLKNQKQSEIIALCEPIAQTLEAFNGKSITGNKKRITDALKNIDRRLYVSIEFEKYFGTKFKVAYYTENRTITRENGQIDYLRGDDFLIWQTVKDNIFNIDDIKTELQRTKESYEKARERTEKTAENIEAIESQVNMLKSALSTLQSNTDTELAEHFGIRF